MELAEDYWTSPTVATLKVGTSTIGIGKTGELQLACENDRYVLNSYFAYPGETVGWNGFSATARGESCWQPLARKLSENQMEVTAKGTFHSLERRVEVKDEAIEITDTLSNLGGEPVGIMARHDLVLQQPSQAILWPVGRKRLLCTCRGPSRRWES